MKAIVSVSKTYNHRGYHKHKSKTKKRWFIYYYEDGEFRTKKVNFLQALYYMTQKRHRLRRVCLKCGNMWIYFVKSRREKLKCPNCFNEEDEDDEEESEDE